MLWMILPDCVFVVTTRKNFMDIQSDDVSPYHGLRLQRVSFYCSVLGYGAAFHSITNLRSRPRGRSGGDSEL